MEGPLDVTIDKPSIVLVFPYEGEPWGGFVPDESVVPRVLEWIERVHPEQAALLERWVDTILSRDG